MRLHLLTLKSPNTWKELGPYVPHVSEPKKTNISKIYLEHRINIPWSYTLNHLHLHKSFFMIYNFIRQFVPFISFCPVSHVNENAFNRKIIIHAPTHCAKDHFSSVRILRNMPAYIVAFTGNKKLTILLRADVCSLLSITQASDGRLGHVLL